MFLQWLPNFRVHRSYRVLEFLISRSGWDVRLHLEVPGLLMLLVGGPAFKNGYVTRFDPHENAVGFGADVEEGAETGRHS